MQAKMQFTHLLAGEKLERRRMNLEIVIRTETSADIDAITEVTIAAFAALEISNHTEQFMIEALRAARGLPGADFRWTYTAGNGRFP